MTFFLTCYFNCLLYCLLYCSIEVPAAHPRLGETRGWRHWQRVRRRSQARTGPRGRGRDPLGQGPGPGPLGPGAWGPLGPRCRIRVEHVTTYCQANYLLSGKLPTVRQAFSRYETCTQLPHTCTQTFPHTCI